MRIPNVESLEQRGTHQLLASDGKLVELRIAPITLAMDMAMNKALPEPQPPYMTTMGPDGKPSGRERLTDDPTYVAKMSEHVLLFAAATAFHGLRDEPKVEWDTPRGDDIEFYRKTLAEMNAAGMSGDEIIRLAKAVRTLSSVTAEMLSKAAESFPTGTAS